MGPAVHANLIFDTCFSEAISSRKAKLKQLLPESGMPFLHQLLKKARGESSSGIEEAVVALEQSDLCSSISHELQMLQVRLQLTSFEGV